MYSLKRMCQRLSDKISKKALVLFMAITMTLASVAGGTLAWIQAGSNPVTNTFTVGDISISLTETDTGLDNDEDVNTNQYRMGVGAVIDKDPCVTVDAWSMDCWLFVAVDQSANFADFMDYAIADGWTPVGEDGRLFVREVDQSEEAQSFFVLKDNQVSVLETVTLSDLAALTEANFPTLSFTAFAVQREGVDTAEAAWQLIAGEE